MAYELFWIGMTVGMKEFKYQLYSNSKSNDGNEVVLSRHEDKIIVGKYENNKFIFWFKETR